MRQIDVFHGDADGVCALHQLRLAVPADAVLVTGTKSDVKLLDRVRGESGDSVAVMDISLAQNRDALLALLDRGVRILYFDHHFAGEIPVHPGFSAVLDSSPGICTSILVDRYLGGAHRIWSVVGAFGDNLHAAAAEIAAQLGLNSGQWECLRGLGECLNYNSYGEEADLAVHPSALYRILHRYPDPFQFLQLEPLWRHLDGTRRDDLAMVQRVTPLENGTIYVLPNQPWSRRIRGHFANELASGDPARPHAVAVEDERGGYEVSVRAPLRMPFGADTLCHRFAGGGGRPAAAAIRHLPQAQWAEFIRLFAHGFDVS